jgi:hypothetical protein
MRLTKLIRQSFVRAAMNDVPSIDYDEQCRKLLVDCVVSQMPPEMLKAYQKYPSMFATHGEYFHRVGYVYFPCSSAIKPKPETMKAVTALMDKASEQGQKKRELQQKLEAAAESVTTRKALAALLPEFEKYLPAEAEGANRQVPAIANLVADFTKAGWPKGQEQKGKK